MEIKSRKASVSGTGLLCVFIRSRIPSRRFDVWPVTTTSQSDVKTFLIYNNIAEEIAQSSKYKRTTRTVIIQTAKKIDSLDVSIFNVLMYKQIKDRNKLQIWKRDDELFLGCLSKAVAKHSIRYPNTQKQKQK